MDNEDFAKKWADFRERLDRGDPKLLAIREHVRRLGRPAPRDVVPPTEAEIAAEEERRWRRDENIALLHGLRSGPAPFSTALMQTPLMAHGFGEELPLEEEPFPEW
jgi:hypothetical protein